jgi:hypothetical protein
VAPVDGSKTALDEGAGGFSGGLYWAQYRRKQCDHLGSVDGYGGQLEPLVFRAMWEMGVLTHVGFGMVDGSCAVFGSGAGGTTGGIGVFGATLGGRAAGSSGTLGAGATLGGRAACSLGTLGVWAAATTGGAGTGGGG